MVTPKFTPTSNTDPSLQSPEQLAHWAREVAANLGTGGGGAPSGPVFSDTDPGAVGAGVIWVDTNIAPYHDFGYPWLIRNATDDGWIEPLLLHKDALGNILIATVLLDTSYQFILQDATQTAFSQWNMDISNGFGFDTVDGTGNEVELRMGAGDRTFLIVSDDAESTVQGLQVTADGVYLVGPTYPSTTPTTPGLFHGTVDPSAGGGFAAPLASTYQRQNGTAGELWCKTGAGDTAWSKLTP